MTQDHGTDNTGEDEHGRPGTSKFRSRRFLRSRNRSREAFASTMHRFGCSENIENGKKDSTMLKNPWERSSITNRKSTTPIT